MSEFKLSGSFYVSEWNGSSGNPGTDVAPFSHPADAPNSSANIIVLGTGIYTGVWTGFRRLYGDGLPVIDCNGSNFCGGAASSYSSPSHQKIKVIRCNNLFGLAAGQNTFINDSYLEFDEIQTGYRLSATLTRCIIKSYTVDTIVRIIVGSQNDPIVQYNSIILSNINFTFTREIPAAVYDCCYLVKGKRIVLNGLEDHFNSCLNGYLNYGGVDYELKKLVDGSARPDSDPLIPDVVSVYPNIYSNGNFATVDPKIIDLENKIVAPDSDLLKKSNTYGFIGGVKPGKAIKKGDSGPDLTITTSQIDTSNPSNWTIGAGYDEGYIFITFKLSDNLVQVPKINMDGLLAFDSSESGGSVGNNNVPDFFPTLYTPLSQSGLKPNRLTYGLRTSQRILKPTSESHWDNDNIALGSDVARYYVQEWSDQPKIYDVLGVTYGGGNPESIGASGNAINARWCQVQIRLTNRREQ